MKNLIIIAVLLLTLSLVSFAQVPNKISYQGLLTTSSGTPVQDGSYDLKFDIYNLSSGGTLRHTETLNDVSVLRGTFSVILRPPSGIFAGSLFVEVTANDGPGISSPITFSPRSELTSAPYAFRADTATYALSAGSTGTIDWSITGNAGTTAGTNFVGTTNAQGFDIRTNNILRTRITTKGQIETYNTGQSVFLGEGAGASDNLNGNNVFVGYLAGFSNTSGYSNVASGREALSLNTTGNNNIANGMRALYVNSVGNRNTSSGSGSLYFNVAGSNATAIGYNAMYYSNNTATPFTNYNVAVGYEALRGSTTPSANTGNYNTALGFQTLFSNTTGTYNTASGLYALYSNTTGSNNTASGAWSLYFNTTGSNNTASGMDALYSNTTGYQNTASGFQSLFSNIAGSRATAVGYNAMRYANNTNIPFDNFNVALGYEALRGSTTPSANTGNSNTALGYQTLFSNTTGYNNTASGRNVLFSNTTGYSNTASGIFALANNTTGYNNTASGSSAGSYNDNNTYCTFVGYDADQGTLTDFTNSVALGNASRIIASNQVRVGNSNVTSIGGYAAWTNLSDIRFKRNVQENVKGLEFIMKLRPVTYNLDVWKLAETLQEDRKRDKDGNITTVQADELTTQSRNEKARIVQSGFAAQDVEIAAKEVGYNFSGVDKPKDENDFYGLRYAEFVVPLVKAMQEQQKIIEELQKRIEVLEGK